MTSHGPATREAFSIDGGRVGVIAWPPDKLRVAGSFKRGEHTLEIAVAGNLRNMLGPHFSGGLPGIWSWLWEGQKLQPAAHYKLSPCGLNVPPKLEAGREANVKRATTSDNYPSSTRVVCTYSPRPDASDSRLLVLLST